jgi:heat shock protein HslJ
VAGKAACNQYNGPYDLGAAPADNWMTANADVGGTISFGAIVSTRMACEEPAMTIEQTYLAALAKVTHYEIRNQTELLLLAADDSRIRFRREVAAP